MQLTNEFEPIRDWAKERGIYEKGTVRGQFEKLLEEVDELKDGIENDDLNEFIDAIGDCVVVLTNMAALNGVPIEFCINSAYEEIKNIKGKIINVTFVKDAN